MIDLHSSPESIADYALRYHHLLPLPSPQLRERMQYFPSPDAEHLPPPGKPDWMASRRCTLSPEQALDRAQGALLGLAIGDAVGTTLEFLPRDREHVTDMVGGGPFRLRAGEWTDDTSMALCLADTYLACGGFDMLDFSARLGRWYQQGENSANGRCFDIGNATRTAIEARLKYGLAWIGNTAPTTAGNGALIRLAPTAIFRRHVLSASWREAQTQSETTHQAEDVYSCCKLFSVMLHLTLNGADKAEALSPRVLPLQPAALIINAGEYKQKAREQIRSSGYVVDTLEAALWAIWNTDTFADAILLAANLGDDADSVAATTGQLAGALYGMSGIPAHWVERVAWSQDILTRARKLFELAPSADPMDAIMTRR